MLVWIFHLLLKYLQDGACVLVAGLYHKSRPGRKLCDGLAKCGGANPFPLLGVTIPHC